MTMIPPSRRRAASGRPRRGGRKTPVAIAAAKTSGGGNRTRAPPCLLRTSLIVETSKARLGTNAPASTRRYSPEREKSARDSFFLCCTGHRRGSPGLDSTHDGACAVFVLALAAQVLLEEVRGALPGEGRRGLVVARSGVVVEAVLRARIGEHLVSHVVGLEGGLERRDAGVDALVVLRVVDEKRRLELLYVLCRRLGDRKSTRLNSSHLVISYAVFCLKKKKKKYSAFTRTC